MLGHLGINVADLSLAKSYYGELMPLVGFEPFIDADDEFAFRPTDNKPGTYLFFYPATKAGGYSSEQCGLQHLAFMVRRRSLVRNVYDHVMRVGGTVIHPPRNFPQYPGHYYATFWYDPFGVKL